jgi:hypothetical protein
MSDACSTAKERDDTAKAMKTINRPMILTMFRRTDLDPHRINSPGRIFIIAYSAGKWNLIAKNHTQILGAPDRAARAHDACFERCIKDERGR